MLSLLSSILPRTYESLMLLDSRRYGGLVAYWPLVGPTSGLVVPDLMTRATGTGYPGTLSPSTGDVWTGGSTDARPGPIAGDLRGGMRFDGVSGRVNLGNVAAFKIPTKTVEMWIRPRVETTIAKSVFGGGANYYVGHTRSSGLQRTISSHNNAAGTQKTVQSTVAAITAGVWQHVAFSWSVSGDNVALLHYVDGIVVLDQTYTDGMRSIYGTSWNISGLGPTSNLYDGDLAHLALWSVAMPAAAIQSHYLAGKYGVS